MLVMKSVAAVGKLHLQAELMSGQKRDRSQTVETIPLKSGQYICSSKLFKLWVDGK